jgi:short-subunit dehydrogenase
MQLTTKEKNRLKSQYGDWAIITGATSGIGLELAKQLASASFHLVLHGRQIERLQALETTLKSSYTIEIRLVVSDLSNLEGSQQLIQATKDLNIGLFVGSAGFGTSGDFIHNKLATEVNMLHVNCESLLVLSYHFGQRFVEKQKGGIILLSSMVAFQGTPFSAN